MPSSADMAAVRAKLAFTCAYEADHLPPLDPDADKLFKYGRYREKKEGPKDFNLVARYYRIAAAYGHYKANNNLQLLISEELADSPDAPRETVDLALQLVRQEVPGGYYDIGHYYETGYGLKYDRHKSLQYFRKAADLGSPDAQYYVAELLSYPNMAPDIARQMYQCAMNQGFGKAASALGMDLQIKKNYFESMQAFQKGVAAGNSQSARFLGHGFNTNPSDRLYYLGLQTDSERSRRYLLIGKFLDENEYLHPKVPDIDKIVPLPPAKLPPWDGTFQWQKEQDAAAPPEQPSEELMHKLANGKNLDPATGLPLPKLSLGTRTKTGQTCPYTGTWRAEHRDLLPTLPQVNQHFVKGETLPQCSLFDPERHRYTDTLRYPHRYTVDVQWRLIGYDRDQV